MTRAVRMSLCLAVWLLAPVLLAQTPAADEERAAILEVARAYAEHVWKAGPENVLHGEASDGVHVDTPDAEHRDDGWHADGRPNVGVPYKWGGFDSLADFDAAVAAGRPAGELTDGVDLAASRESVGVDCSGFVARCWGLPGKQSTRSLGQLSYSLESFDDLLPGDLINKFDAHAMLFVGFVDETRERVEVIEATLPKVKRSEYPVAGLARSGFAPYRYKPLDARWVVVPSPGAATLELTPGGRFIPDAEPDAEPGGGAQVADRLATASAGDWATYRLTGEDAEGPFMLVSRAVAQRDGEGLLVQTASEMGGGIQRTQRVRPLSDGLVERLLAIEDDRQPMSSVEVLEHSTRSGRFVTPAGASLQAVATRFELTLGMVMRGQRVAIDCALEAVFVDDARLEGLVLLRDEQTWNLPEGPVSGTQQLWLTACGAAAGP